MPAAIAPALGDPESEATTASDEVVFVIGSSLEI
jgi:hypothetical protein